MQEAMRIMRRELGEEAVVVNTRSIVQRRAFPWLKAKSEVEVIARVDDSVRNGEGVTVVAGASRPSSEARRLSHDMRFHFVGFSPT